MLRSKPYTKLEAKELFETCLAGTKRAKSRIILLAGLALIMTLIYPYKIILIWYISMMVVDLLNTKCENLIIRAYESPDPLNPDFLPQFFIISWAESLCMVALIIALSFYEGQVSHFIPYIVLLCASIYIATSTFHNAILMFGHLALYNLTLLFVSARDVALTYPDTNSIIWVQFLASILIALFLTDSYRFFHKLHIEGREKSREVDEARKHAEKLNQQKSDLISTIGHELRTPLTGILGFSQIIKRSDLSEKQHEYIALIEGAGKNIHLLLTNILDSENLEQDRLRLCIVETDIHALLTRTFKFFEYSAHKKGIVLSLEIDTNIPSCLMIDEIRLGQCVSNLLSNAVRFTHSGKIVVRASYRNEPDPLLSISVNDTGIGIPKDQTSKIFEKFSRAEIQSSVQGGTGLGLWLVKSIAKAMNGELTLVKTSPQGSEFLLAFKLETQPLIPPVSSTTLINQRILHIEDTETNLMLIRLLLEEQGAIITDAKTGKDAIELLQDTTFDAILCDLQLPDCNGNQLLLEIRALKTQNVDIPVIALTAQPEKIGPIKLKNGFTAILSKPIDQKTLISTLIELQNNNRVS